MAIGIEPPVPRVDAARDRQAAVRAADRQDHRRRRPARRRIADQRLDHGPALHLVVVLADDPLLAANVPVPQQGEQVGRQSPALGQLERPARAAA